MPLCLAAGLQHFLAMGLGHLLAHLSSRGKQLSPSSSLLLSHSCLALNHSRQEEMRVDLLKQEWGGWLWSWTPQKEGAKDGQDEGEDTEKGVKEAVVDTGAERKE